MTEKEWKYAKRYWGVAMDAEFFPFFLECWGNFFSVAHDPNDNTPEVKLFQIIREYPNGEKKISAKRYPPVSKGIKRDRETFRTYDRELYNSISRSRAAICELAKCNNWEYYAHFTISPNKFDRYDLKPIMKAFSKWMANYSDRKLGKGRRIKYLLVPEMGRDDAWHLHGLLSGIPKRHLSPFDKTKPRLRRLIEDGYLNWKPCANKFGFCAIGKVRDIDAAVQYMLKKVTKTLATQMRGLHERLYYCSHGLERSIEIARGYNLIDVDNYDYENEWVGVKWLNE